MGKQRKDPKVYEERVWLRCRSSALDMKILLGQGTELETQRGSGSGQGRGGE